MACALPSRHPLFHPSPHPLPHAPHPKQITLIEANELLGSFDARLREYTARKLVKEGVQLVKGVVKEVRPQELELQASPSSASRVAGPVAALAGRDSGAWLVRAAAPSAAHLLWGCACGLERGTRTC